jgi:alpha-beta hydrolase superfamily lysophospholipase
MSADATRDYRVLDRPDVLQVLFHPRRTEGPVDGGDRFRELLIPVDDDVSIGARFYPAPDPAATILFFHGNGEIVPDYDAIAPLFGRTGVNFFVVDYRGYGISGGQPTVSAMMRDAHRIFRFVVDFLGERAIEGPLIVMGRSLGSASALELAASYTDRISGLIIESGFAWAGPLLELLGIAPGRIGLDRSAGFANLEAIRKYFGPTLVIHAEFDHIIPFSDGQALYDASPAETKVLIMIRGANHNDIFIRGMDYYLEAIHTLVETCTAAAPGNP